MKEGEEMLITFYLIFAGFGFYTLVCPPLQEKEKLAMNQKLIIKVNDSPLTKEAK